MDLRELESVVAVYTHKSFSEAAYQTSFSASVISKHVKRVEQELGVVLFNRRTHENAQLLTEAGEQLMPALLRAVDDLHFVQRQAQRFREDDMKLCLAGVSMLHMPIFEGILTDFCLHYPEVRIEVVHTSRMEQIRGIQSGQIDGGFTLYVGLQEGEEPEDPDVEGLERMVIARASDLYIGISDKHPLAEQESIDLRDLAEETFIFNNVRENDGQADTVTRMTGRRPEQVKKRYMDFKQYHAVLQVIAAGQGVLPKVTAERTAFPGVRFVPVKDWNLCAAYTFLYHRSNRSKALQLFKSCVRERREQLRKMN